MKKPEAKPSRSPRGRVTIPLPPELVEFNNRRIVTPKSPDAFEREEEERISELRKLKGL